MFIEILKVENFKCFGPTRTVIKLDRNLTALIGTNGTGKTATCEALMRLFGITTQDRTVQTEDFHVPADEIEAPSSRTLSIEAVLGFPELSDQRNAAEQIPDGTQKEHETSRGSEPWSAGLQAVPEFFSRMAANQDGELKVRIVLMATWEDDGTVDGTITENRIVVSTFADEFGDDEYAPLPAAERSRIQVIYIPASRDGARQVATFLRSRLWRAAQWSPELRDLVSQRAGSVADRFTDEPVVKAVEHALTTRWQQLHDAGMYEAPKLRLLDDDFDQLVRNTELIFEPDPTGRARPARMLSDGQRSLLHLALTAATLDVEAEVHSRSQDSSFTLDPAQMPNLTLIAVEEPENSLSPFYLSRIVEQLQSLARGTATQAVLSSHSASALTRIAPEAVSHFRTDRTTVTTSVRPILLPDDHTEAGKYLREAVRAHPELYFAKFVVLGEGDTEQLVIPRIAQAQGVQLDPSFIAMVPLGGRHTQHMWKLLNDLAIPHATLLDLDYGRAGAGPARLRDACSRLSDNGIDALVDLDGYDNVSDITDDLRLGDLGPVIQHLRTFGVFFAEPLDLDYVMLERFTTAYTSPSLGKSGPRSADATSTVIGEGNSDPDFWAAANRPDLLRWYRYLFHTGSKPSSHLQALSHLSDDDVRDNAPEVLSALVEHIRTRVGL